MILPFNLNDLQGMLNKIDKLFDYTFEIERIRNPNLNIPSSGISDTGSNVASFLASATASALGSNGGNKLIYKKIKTKKRHNKCNTIKKRYKKNNTKRRRLRKISNHK